MEFSGRVALITGAAQSIGFECGRILCAGGADVILVDINEAGLLAAQKELEGLGKPVAIYTCDVADEEAVNQVIASVMERYSKIDILVNNAGIYRPNRGPFAQSKSEHWRQKIDINIYGTLYFTRGVINSMLEQKYGRIINIASVAGTYGIANMADYSLTKGAILAFSKALAREVSESGVLVNTVSPGNINPDPNFGPKSSYMNRSGHPRECAEAVCFLASDKASFVSGCDYVVDGCRRKL